MIDIKKIYVKEKIINRKFRKKYDYSNPNIFYKQVLELIVEFSELAYETKCFKYWKNDKPSDVEVIAAEYTDCLMIILCFCDLANIEINDLPEIYEKDIVKQFIKLNNLASQITMGIDKQLLLEILSNLLNLSALLKFNDSELEKYCTLKMDKTLAMISGKQKI
jgi:dimeric dUTPase (all-alpha-NTP-PPase superfamily)